MRQSERNQTLDYMRGFAMLMVIFMHALQRPGRKKCKLFFYKKINFSG